MSTISAQTSKRCGCGRAFRSASAHAFAALKLPQRLAAVERGCGVGIPAGANQPYDIAAGELALIFANAGRIFDAAENASR